MRLWGGYMIRSYVSSMHILGHTDSEQWSRVGKTQTIIKIQVHIYVMLFDCLNVDFLDFWFLTEKSYKVMDQSTPKIKQLLAHWIKSKLSSLFQQVVLHIDHGVSGVWGMPGMML